MQNLSFSLSLNVYVQNVTRLKMSTAKNCLSSRGSKDTWHITAIQTSSLHSLRVNFPPWRLLGWNLLDNNYPQGGSKNTLEFSKDPLGGAAADRETDAAEIQCKRCKMTRFKTGTQALVCEYDYLRAEGGTGGHYWTKKIHVLQTNTESTSVWKEEIV